jgi:hypothetical protein
MTTPEQHDPAERWVRHVPERTGPQRGPAAAAAAAAAAPKAPSPAPVGEGVRDPDVLIVNEAVAETVRTAYDVLNDTVKQGRKAAEQFRGGTYNVRDVPDDVRHMAANMLGLAKQLSTAAFEICETLLRQADTLMTPPPPGSTHVPPFPEPKSHPAQQPGAQPIATPVAPMIALDVLFNGKETVRAHTTTLARPEAPTGAAQIGCDGLAQRGGSAAPITDVVFDTNPHGPGLRVMVTVPKDQPAGVYSGAVYCTTQPLPLGQLVIEVD